MGRHFHVPAQTFVYAVTPLFLFLFPWCVSCYFPPNRFPSAASLPQMRETPLLKHLQVLGLFTLPLSHSFPRGTDVTANPISKCVGSREKFQMAPVSSSRTTHRSTHLLPDLTHLLLVLVTTAGRPATPGTEQAGSFRERPEMQIQGRHLS